MSHPIPDFLTQIEIARILRLDSRTIEQWRSRKKGPPYYRLGGLRGNIVYDAAEFLSWLARQKIDPSTLAERSGLAVSAEVGHGDGKAAGEAG